MWVCRLFLVDFHGRRLVTERADEAISIAIFRDSDGYFCFDNGINAAYFVRNLPGALKEQVVMYIAFVFDVRHGGKRVRHG
jgi:hypothetical protein